MFKEKWYYSPWIIGILFALWLFIIPPIVAIVLIFLRYKELKTAKKQWEDSGLSDLQSIQTQKRKSTE